MDNTYYHVVRDWQGFYQVTGESAATLTGLMFVTTTVGARAFTPTTLPILRSISSPILSYFTTAFLTSAVMCIPTQSQHWLSSEVGLIALMLSVRLTLMMRTLRRWHRQRPFERRHWVLRAGLPITACLSMAYAAITLWSGRLFGLDFICFAVLLLLLNGIFSAWEMTLQSMVVSDEDIVMIESIGVE